MTHCATPKLRRLVAVFGIGRRNFGLVAEVVAGVVVMGLVAVACTRGSDAAAPVNPGSVPREKITFADVDRAMQERLTRDGLPGGADLVVRDGRTLHDQTYGSYTRTTRVPIASASKWLTSAVLLTLVDAGTLDLDAPVSTYLPEWRGDKQGVTLRLLLSHRAGVSSSVGCLGDPARTVRDCANELAARDLVSPPGTNFAYGNAGYTVAAAAAEAATGTDFTTLFRARLTEPLGMSATSFPIVRDDEDPAHTNPNPLVAAGAVSTLDDYAAFVRMMAAEGVAPDGRRILSAAAVHEIEKDQVAGLDTHDDAAVQITGFATYGLGVWRDRADAADRTEMVSGSGSVGFYPWIDRTRHAYGILLVNDGAGGGGRAVRTSTSIVHDLVLPAIDNAT